MLSPGVNQFLVNVKDNGWCIDGSSSEELFAESGELAMCYCEYGILELGPEVDFIIREDSILTMFDYLLNEVKGLGV